MICQERVDTYMENIMNMNPLDTGFLDSQPTDGEEEQDSMQEDRCVNNFSLIWL